MKHIVKFILIFFAVSLETVNSYAKVFESRDFAIDMPESFTHVKSDELLFYFVDVNTNNAVSIVYGNSGNFGSHDPLYKYGDISTIKSSKNFFLRLNKKFAKRYYKAGDVFLMQYTFNTYKHTYSLLFKYSSERDVRTINDIVKSIKIKDSWLKRMSTTYSNGAWIWVLFFILISVSSALLYQKGNSIEDTMMSATVISLIYSPLLLLFLWGSWDIFLTFIIITFVVSYIAARTGVFLSLGAD